jgi:hypothetical protein
MSATRPLADRTKVIHVLHLSRRSLMIREEVTAIRIEVQLVRLRRLAMLSTSAFERLDATLSRALREMIIDDDRPNSSH